MRVYTTQPPFYGGSALPARLRYVCSLAQRGEGLGPRQRQSAPETCLKAMAPSRQGLVVAVACRVPWSWLAALCAAAGRPCVLGHALAMQAIQGGKANHAKSDAQKIAAWLRGGMLLPAYGSPAKRRATRDVRRHRMPLAPQRAALLAPGQHTHRQYPMPALGTQLADHATRAGGAERCAAAAGQKRRAVALALLPSYAARRRDVALPSVNTARPHDAPTR